MIRELRDALGLPDIAIPKPPAEVWAEALEAVREHRKLLDWAHELISHKRLSIGGEPHEPVQTPH